MITLDNKWSRERLHSLRMAYQAAVDSGKDSFKFEGDELLTSYARYVIEALEVLLINK